MASGGYSLVAVSRLLIAVGAGVGGVTETALCREQGLSLGLGTGCPVMGEQGPGLARGWALRPQDAGSRGHGSEDADWMSRPLVGVEGVWQVT